MDELLPEPENKEDADTDGDQGEAVEELACDPRERACQRQSAQAETDDPGAESLLRKAAGWHQGGQDVGHDEAHEQGEPGGGRNAELVHGTDFDRRTAVQEWDAGDQRSLHLSLRSKDGKAAVARQSMARNGSIC